MKSSKMISILTKFEKNIAASTDCTSKSFLSNIGKRDHSPKKSYFRSSEDPSVSQTELSRSDDDSSHVEDEDVGTRMEIEQMILNGQDTLLDCESKAGIADLSNGAYYMGKKQVTESALQESKPLEDLFSCPSSNRKPARRHSLMTVSVTSSTSMGLMDYEGNVKMHARRLRNDMIDIGSEHSVRDRMNVFSGK